MDKLKHLKFVQKRSTEKTKVEGKKLSDHRSHYIASAESSLGRLGAQDQGCLGARLVLDSSFLLKGRHPTASAMCSIPHLADRSLMRRLAM